MINGLRKDLKRAVADGKLSLAAYECIISHPEIESITRAQDKKDHGINGVARQKDVQKLEKRVDTLSNIIFKLVEHSSQGNHEDLMGFLATRIEVSKDLQKEFDSIFRDESTPSGSGEV